MVCSCAVSAQMQHSIYLSAGGNVGFLIDNGGYTAPKVGGGGSFGFGYELQQGSLLFEAGAECGFNRMRSHVNDFVRSYDAIDTEGDAFKWNHSFYERTDEADVLNVNVPIMLGGKFRYVYFLAGPKLSVNMWGRSREKSLVDASGKYEGLLGEFKEMDNHSFIRGRQLKDGWLPYSTDINLRVAAEAGVPINNLLTNVPGEDMLTYAGVELRVGVFFEAGVLNLRGKRTDGDLVNYSNVETAPGVDFKETYVFRASETQTAYMTDMLAGVRFTVLFRMPEKKICVLCGDD